MTGPDAEPADRLQTLESRAAQLESLLTTGRNEAGTIVAEELLAETEAWLAEIDQNPGRDPGAEAELVAALRVYRNAVFAFRRLRDQSVECDPSMEEICRTLIAQGHDHLALYRGTRRT